MQPTPPNPPEGIIPIMKGLWAQGWIQTGILLVATLVASVLLPVVFP
jgi:hypothetical protein